jgi:hypothetical protein
MNPMNTDKKGASIYPTRAGKTVVFKWTGPGLNRRHSDFQSDALPAELPVLVSALLLAAKTTQKEQNPKVYSLFCFRRKSFVLLWLGIGIFIVAFYCPQICSPSLYQLSYLSSGC